MASFEVFLIDEAHELRKTTIMILAILKNFLKRQLEPYHKLIVTSATLDTEVFKEYFADLKMTVIEAKTPTYDVQQFYTQFPDLSTSIVENTAAHLRIMMEHLMKHFSSEYFLPNILVFLPSIKEIKEIRTHIEEDHDKSFSIISESLPHQVQELHGGLKPSEKSMVLDPDPKLKKVVRIILATKIAETALTIEDVRYVLDSGLHTEYFFDELTKMDYSKKVPISKSSAIQRKGRAGRTAKGFCFKMYTEEEELEFDDTNIPEILRMDVADVIMTQIELQNLYKMSDLLFYKEMNTPRSHSSKSTSSKPPSSVPAGSPPVNNLIDQIVSQLTKLNALEVDISTKSTVLTNKGKFMIQMGIKGLTAAFLYECIRLGIRELGEAATTVLNTKNLFRDNVSVDHAAKT